MASLPLPNNHFVAVISPCSTIDDAALQPSTISAQAAAKKKEKEANRRNKTERRRIEESLTGQQKKKRNCGQQVNTS
jgi:hypothetical protein